MDFTETEVVEVQLRYGKCAYSERNDINIEHLFIVSLKTIKKTKENQIFPLISFMEDQVSSLNEKGVKAIVFGARKFWNGN